MQNQEYMDFLRRGGEGPCPCCGRFNKIYERRLHTTICRQLIILYRAGAADHYVHSKKAGGPDFTIAKFWGLIQSKPNDSNRGKKDSGFWALTKLGVEFVQNLAAVPTYAFLYNDQVLKFSEEMSDIEECLGRKFNYSELMGYL